MAAMARAWARGWPAMCSRPRSSLNGNRLNVRRLECSNLRTFQRSNVEVRLRAMINHDRLLATFLDLVRIDNPSGGEGPIAAHIRGLLEGMGLAVEQDGLHNLLARVPGAGEPLLLNAHMDSVAPCHGVRPVVADGVVYSGGDTVLGADDLAGVAAILEGVRATLERGEAHRAAEILFTVQEEV